jgi:hypothetical protein
MGITIRNILIWAVLFTQGTALSEAQSGLSIKKFSAMVMTTPCYTELELPARDSASAIKFIKKLSKSLKGADKPKTFSIKANTIDYLFNSHQKSENWSLWISVGPQGIRHITETWQSPDELVLKKHLYESLSDGLDSWGEISEENEDETWFKWNRTEFGCGVKTLIFVQEKRNKFVSRRIQLNEE